MKYQIENWPISLLMEKYEKGILNLSPIYQRNAIWSKKAQLLLIDSIKNGFPLPTFFIRILDNGKIEMVDGQQRSRAILRYYRTNELDDSSSNNEEFKSQELINYILNVTIITQLQDKENIEDFYYRVNSTGLHLNRPEKIKARNLRSNLFALADKIATSDYITELELFSDSSLRRMLDRDLIEEIIALIKYGITEKKKQVDSLYDVDITGDDAKDIEKQFIHYMEIIRKFNKIKPIKDTRYRQRNDFYTLISFLRANSELTDKILEQLYVLLVVIDKEIRPSKFTASPFSEYAQHCVSQSNSESARKERLHILTDHGFSRQ